MVKNLMEVSRMIMELNKFISKDSANHEYHMKHIELVGCYSLILNKKLGGKIPYQKLLVASYAHDLFKEKNLDKSKDGMVVWKEYNIPQNTTAYVRLNLDILELYGLDDYFNSDVQYHPLSAGIFLIKELGITDPEILYPVMFHSCPIIPIYQTLSPTIQTMVDILVLADKLSSNYLKINYLKKAVRTDLDLAVFGSNGYEFNYSLGLLLARLIAQDKSKQTQTVLATEYYYQKLVATNPLIKKEIDINKIGVKKIWPERESQVLMIN